MADAAVLPVPAPLDWQACWQRVQNPSAPGPDFYYGVASTGVFCQPGCPSRRPNPENVHFFRDSDDALAAGFRPCKRCQPDDSRGSPAARRAAEAVRAACSMIDEALSDGEAAPSLAALASAQNLSPFHFQRLFKRLTGLSPSDYARGRRQGRLIAALAQGDDVSGAIYDAGFGGPAAAYAHLKACTGATPAAIAGRAGVLRLTYGLVATDLGRTLVAATEAGIAAVFFGDDDCALERELKLRFPKATLTHDEAALAPLLAAVGSLATDPKQAADLPLDLRGTAFEISVWQALRAIPPGETRSYGALAAAIGKPKAARAVGRACGANPVSLIVPCHRALGADGSLTGYRWGTARKRHLLEKEGTLNPKPTKAG